jgi:hypothetical protein
MGICGQCLSLTGVRFGGKVIYFGADDSDNCSPPKRNVSGNAFDNANVALHFTLDELVGSPIVGAFVGGDRFLNAFKFDDYCALIQSLLEDFCRDSSDDELATGSQQGWSRKFSVFGERGGV